MPSIAADALPNSNNASSTAPAADTAVPSAGPVAVPQTSNGAHGRIYHTYHSPPYYYPQQHQQQQQYMAASPLSSGYATAVAGSPVGSVVSGLTAIGHHHHQHHHQQHHHQQQQQQQQIAAAYGYYVHTGHMSATSPSASPGSEWMAAGGGGSPLGSHVAPIPMAPPLPHRAGGGGRAAYEHELAASPPPPPPMLGMAAAGPMATPASDIAHVSATEAVDARNVYIRNLPEDCTDDALVRLACAYGDIESSKSIIHEATGKCKGYGFVKYRTAEQAARAISGFSGQGYESTLARDSFKARLKRLQDKNSANVYVSNLPPDVDEAALAELIKPHVVVSARILRDAVTGQHKGAGFARMADRETAQRVIDSLKGMRLPNAPGPLMPRIADSEGQKQLKKHVNAEGSAGSGSGYARGDDAVYVRPTSTSPLMWSPVLLYSPAAASPPALHAFDPLHTYDPLGAAHSLHDPRSIPGASPSPPSLAMQQSPVLTATLALPHQVYAASPPHTGLYAIPAPYASYAPSSGYASPVGYASSAGYMSPVPMAPGSSPPPLAYSPEQPALPQQFGFPHQPVLATELASEPPAAEAALSSPPQTSSSAASSSRQMARPSHRHRRRSSSHHSSSHGGSGNRRSSRAPHHQHPMPRHHAPGDVELAVAIEEKLRL